MENTMRKILKALMDKHNDTPTSLSKKTVTGGQKGISQSTIFRFIKGDVKFITPETAKALAEVYGLTESQLRGDMPIDKEVLDIETKVYRVEDPVKQDIPITPSQVFHVSILPSPFVHFFAPISIVSAFIVSSQSAWAGWHAANIAATINAPNNGLLNITLSSFIVSCQLFTRSQDLW